MGRTDHYRACEHAHFAHAITSEACGAQR